MKLYLSSYRLGDQPSVLPDLVGDSGRRAALVFNALDHYSERLANFDREATDLAGFGFDSEELDLRRFFSAPDRLRAVLASFDLLWVVGGNAFILARAMMQSRFADAARDLVDEDRLVYAGYSAGACVLAPDLEGVRLMDKPELIPPEYPPTAEPAALGWIPWRIVPHWRSDHPESESAERAVAFLDAHDLPYKTLQDGQALICDGSGFRVVPHDWH
jgi:dipeptidase E